MKNKFIAGMLIASLSLSLFSCGEKPQPKIEIKDTPLHRLDLGDASRITFEGIDDPNAVKEKPSSTGDILGANNRGQTINLCELTLSNHDDTKYYEVVGDDIIYNGVMYIGLNRSLDIIKSPYDKRDLINFLIKAINPTHYAMVSVVFNDKDESSTSLPLDQVLEGEWELYSKIKNKYGGNKIWWQLDLYDPVTEKTAASLYGGDTYILYRGDKGELKVDLAKLEYKKPEITDTPKYLQDILDGYKDYTGKSIMSSVIDNLSEEEYQKFYGNTLTEQEWIDSGVLG